MHAHTHRTPSWIQPRQGRTGFSTERYGKAFLWSCRVQHEDLWCADVLRISGLWEAYSWVTSILNSGCHCYISLWGWNTIMWPTGCLSHKLYVFGKVHTRTTLAKIRINVTEQIHFPHNLGWDTKKCFWHPYITYVYRAKKNHASIISTSLCSGGFLISLQNRQIFLYINTWGYTLG